MRYLELSRRHGWPRVLSIQNPYSLLNRSYEIGLAEISHREQIGLLAYSPLGFGVLTGKYLNGSKPEGSRLRLFERFSRYSNSQGQTATERYAALAQTFGLSAAQMALAFVIHQQFVVSAIIGATNLDQLEENIASINVHLSKDVLDIIEEIHTALPNPCP